METRRRDFVAESLEDLHHAISELAKALGDQPRQRRAEKAVVNELYRLQGYRREPGGSATSYYSRANSTASGFNRGNNFYLSDVADRPVLDTVRIARDFLITDTVLGPRL